MSPNLSAGPNLDRLLLVGVDEVLNYPLFHVGTSVIRPVGVLQFLLILALGWWLSKAVRHAVTRLSAGGVRFDPGAAYTLSRILHYAILGIAVVLALSSMGVNLSNLAFLGGAVGVGLGFGLRNIFSNFISGIILLFEKTLKVGDFIELPSGIRGMVKEINVRFTRITTNDDVDMLVPNSDFINGQVVNWSFDESIRRIHVPFGVAYGSDRELVRRAVIEAARGVPRTATGEGREPQVWLTGFGDSSLDFELVVWVDRKGLISPGATHAAYTWAIAEALDAHGIEIPFPQRDLHLRSGVLAVQRAPRTAENAEPAPRPARLAPSSN